MNQIYNRAKAHPGKPMWFNWPKVGFNMDPYKAIKTKAWPFGRVSANVVGRMTVANDGSYEVAGSMSYNDDTYSWDLDGNGWGHNAGIFLLGKNFNGPGRGDMQFANLLSQEFLPDPQIQHVNVFKSLTMGAFTNQVEWAQPSPAYQSSGGKMPVTYPRVYNFQAWGQGK